jgi:hypothetical protein
MHLVQVLLEQTGDLPALILLSVLLVVEQDRVDQGDALLHLRKPTGDQAESEI